MRILILTEDLRLIEANTKIPYRVPKEGDWDQDIIKNYDKNYIEQMKRKNSLFLKEILNHEKIDEIFLALGSQFRKTLPDLNSYKCKIILPRGGIGPTAQFLKKWLLTQ